jgi:hypothetical protein
MQLRWNVIKAAALFATITMLTFLVLPQSLAQQPQAQTLTGVLSDAACGATHTMKNMSAADCALMCAKQAGYALVVGKDVYALKGHAADLDKLAAKTVTVTGTINGKTITVESVAPTKKG